MNKVCPTCKQHFSKPANYSLRHFQSKIYCSNKCRAAIKKNGAILTCLNCPTTFYARPCEQRKFCTKPCADLYKFGKSIHNSGQFKKGDNAGENHYNWKGGNSSELHQIRTSTEYKKWRTAVFIKDGFRCLDCGEKGVRLNADHIYPFAYFPRLRFDINNGRTLCVECHKKTPTYAGKIINYMKNGHTQNQRVV